MQFCNICFELTPYESSYLRGLSEITARCGWDYGSLPTRLRLTKSGVTARKFGLQYHKKINIVSRKFSHFPFKIVSFSNFFILLQSVRGEIRTILKHSLLFRVKPRASETQIGIKSTKIICEGGWRKVGDLIIYPISEACAIRRDAFLG